MSTDAQESAPAAEHGAGPDPVPGAGDGEPSFEALYERLDQVAQELGAGGLSLEKSIALYEEGMRLAASCERLLDGVEQRIEMLRKARATGAAGPGESPGGRLL